MKVQMVIVANAREERGRSLVGIRLQDGKLMMRNGLPFWLRPVLQRSKTSIPTPMVVDLMPLDVIEFDLQEGAELDDPDGYVPTDFYQLKIVGRMPLDELLDCCILPTATAIGLDDEDHVPAEGVLGQALCMVLACQCAVISPMQGPERQNPALQFGYCGRDFQFPLADPLFLEHMAVSTENLVCQRSVQIVLSPCRRRKGKPVDFKVLSVLL